MRRISDLPEDEARDALRACCSSSRWVERMLSQRPFRDEADVYDSAERIWLDLEPKDWLEAFAAHPKIGGTGGQGHGGTGSGAEGHGGTGSGAEGHGGTGAQWSASEQSQVGNAADDVKAQLAQANLEYEARFGHIYIVCATGKSAGEMLEICRARLANEPDAELKVAAGEQAKITKLRIDKLLALGK